MTTFHLRLDADEQLDINHAVELLRRKFPSTIVEGDTFERKRQRLAESIAALSDQGTPIRNPDLHHQILARGEAEVGPGLDVAITLDDSTKITGSITAGAIRLSSHSQLQPDVVREVQNYLLSLKIGKIIVSHHLQTARERSTK
jgi:hypothetical protein